SAFCRDDPRDRGQAAAMPLLRILSASAAAVALAATASGCNNSSSAATGPNTGKATGNTTVKGTLDEWSVGVSNAKVSPGEVTFDVTNAGKVKHEFVVLRTDKAAD